MNNKMMKQILGALALSMLAFQLLAADVTIKSKNLDESRKEAGTTNFYFTADRLLIENQFKSDNNSLIFDSGKKEFIFIDHGKKEYYQVTEDELRQFVGQLRQMMQMTKALMANLPPEQQEALKKSLGELLDADKKPTTSFNKTASNVKVKSWSADKYEALQGSDKVADIYLASYGNLGVSKEDFQSFESMRRIFSQIIGEFAGVLPLGPSVKGLASNLEENPAFDSGVPVRSVTYANGAQSGENIVESVSRSSISNGKFAIPTGYVRKQLEMPKMR